MSKTAYQTIVTLSIVVVVLAALFVGLVLGGVLQTTRTDSVARAPGWSHFTSVVTRATYYHTTGAHPPYLPAPQEVIPLVDTANGKQVAIPLDLNAEVGSTIHYSCRTTRSTDDGPLIDLQGASQPYLYWPGSCFADEFRATWYVPL